MKQQEISGFLAVGCGLLLFGAGLTSTGRAAALQQASITEAVNSVSYQTNENSPQQAAQPGTIVHSDNVIRTGVKSRAELKFNDDTVTRMGANSVFTFDAQSQKLNLEQGSILFSKPKNADTFEISTPAATCAISGTTGFLELLPEGNGSKKYSFLFGLIEGHTKIALGGASYPLSAGNMLVRDPNGVVRLIDFNIATFLQQAGLVRHFKSTLPNQKEIEHEEKRFTSLEHRGFVEPTKLTLVSGDSQFAVRQDLTASNSPNSEAFAAQIQNFQQEQRSIQPSGGFENVGGSGVIRGQLIWTSLADLDLHLVLPGGAGEVFYGNTTITFNGGKATAALDHDNTGGGTPPTLSNGERIENIYVTGVVPSGNYDFYVHSYATPDASDNYTLITTTNGGATTQTQTGTLAPNQNSAPIVVPHS